MRYMPALDGLRAIAVLMVLLLHCRVPGFGGGGVGVDVFFVLSGYLITRVLAEHRPSLREFYVHRAYRLIPPLALLLAAYLTIFPVLVPDHPHGRDALLAALYLSDYSFAFAREPTYLAHTWSLSVEEHFYLIWPLVLYRLKPSIKALCGAYAVALLWRWAPDHVGAYFRFDTRMTALLFGCAIAYLPRGKVAAWPGIAGVVAVCLLDPFDAASKVDGMAATIAIEAAAAVAILGRPPSWLSAAPIVYMGRISYGIYLWHLPIAKLLRDVYHFDWLLLITCTAGASIPLAALSYHTVEAWSRRLKNRGTLRLARQS